MTDVIAGQSVTLLSQWYDFEGGSLTDLDATPSITIVNIGTGTPALGTTTTGVTHPGTGSYGYTWTPATSLTAGEYLATWTGTKASAPVTAAETITVTAAGTQQAAVNTEGVWYCTREDVKGALDIKETARSNAEVDRAIAAATRTVEGLLNRTFYPLLATRYFDWPDQYARSWRLWLDASELIELYSLTAGGVAIPNANVNLEPNRTGPPYRRIELRLDTNSAFGGGQTPQRNIAVWGLWGYQNNERPAGQVAAAATDTATTLAVSDSGTIGVGQLLRIGSERLIVTEKAMRATGQTLSADLSTAKNSETMHVPDGTQLVVGETLLVDAERMLVIDIAGNQATVKRAWDGSTLAAHTTGAPIYAPRLLTVTRGALGTTAAAIAQGAQIVAWQVPGPVRQLATAEAIVTELRASSGYAAQTGVGSQSRTVGGGQAVRSAPGVGIADLRDQVYASHGRKARTRAV
jgi:hypothetical protein